MEVIFYLDKNGCHCKMKTIPGKEMGKNWWGLPDSGICHPSLVVLIVDDFPDGGF